MGATTTKIGWLVSMPTFLPLLPLVLRPLLSVETKTVTGGNTLNAALSSQDTARDKYPTGNGRGWAMMKIEVCQGRRILIFVIAGPYDPICSSLEW